MRYLYMAAAFILMLGTAAIADENSPKGGDEAAKQGTVAQVQGKEIDVSHPTALADEAESGVNSEREMPQHETYDENTGLPNVVPSDKEGEM
jgi:hypothetical protein